MTSVYAVESQRDLRLGRGDFFTYVNAHLADLGLAAGDVADVNAAHAVWTTACPTHAAADTAARSARQSKDDARGGLEGAVRPLVRRR